MKLTKKEILIVIFLCIIILIINYSWIDSFLIESFLTDEFVKIDRIIDGDTIVSNGTSIRLLGINTPEKKEKYYPEAKDFLEKEVLNKTVLLRYGKDKKDKYGRTLAYVFSVSEENINLKLIQQGLANYYFPSGKDIYYDEFKQAWENCIKDNKNLCEKSINICANCIELKDLDYDLQESVFFNKCDFDCDLKNWTIKDEGRKKFIFPDIKLKKREEIKIKIGDNQETSNLLFWQGETYVWTKTGDTLFLRDEQEKLVIWYSY